MFIKRALESVVKEVAKGSRSYVSLDDPVARQLAKEEPLLFIQRYAPPVIIDEIQYAPELLPYIKIHVDTHKQNGDFWLTGSQMFQTMKGVRESLAGRVGIIPMQGLSLSEITEVPSEPFTTDPQRLLQRLNWVKKLDLQEVYQLIYRGSMPVLHTTDQPVERYYASYVSYIRLSDTY